MTHTPAHTFLAAGAALDDLDVAERAEQARLASGCPGCASLAVDLDEVLADLALDVPQRVPPPDLLAGIRAAIGAGQTTASIPTAFIGAARGPAAMGPAAWADASKARPSSRWRLIVASRPVYGALALAAAMAIVAVGLGARTASLASELNGTRSELTALRMTVGDQGAAMAVAMDPAHRSASLAAQALAPGGVATVVYVPGTTEAWLVADHLPATPAGDTYQLWYADGAGVHPLATATYTGSGPFVARVGVDLAHAAAVMITLEPAGGATGGPGPEVMFGTL